MSPRSLSDSTSVATYHLVNARRGYFNAFPSKQPRRCSHTQTYSRACDNTAPAMNDLVAGASTAAAGLENSTHSGDYFDLKWHNRTCTVDSVASQYEKARLFSCFSDHSSSDGNACGDDDENDCADVASDDDNEGADAFCASYGRTHKWNTMRTESITPDEKVCKLTLAADHEQYDEHKPLHRCSSASSCGAVHGSVASRESGGDSECGSDDDQKWHTQWTMPNNEPLEFEDEDETVEECIARSMSMYNIQALPVFAQSQFQHQSDKPSTSQLKVLTSVDKPSPSYRETVPNKTNQTTTSPSSIAFAKTHCLDASARLSTSPTSITSSASSSSDRDEDDETTPTTASPLSPLTPLSADSCSSRDSSKSSTSTSSPTSPKTPTSPFKIARLFFKAENGVLDARNRFGGDAKGKKKAIDEVEDADAHGGADAGAGLGIDSEFINFGGLHTTGAYSALPPIPTLTRKPTRSSTSTSTSTSKSLILKPARPKIVTFQPHSHFRRQSQSQSQNKGKIAERRKVDEHGRRGKKSVVPGELDMAFFRRRMKGVLGEDWERRQSVRADLEGRVAKEKVV